MTGRAVIFDLGQVVVKWEPARAVAALFDSDAQALAALEAAGFAAWNLEQDRGRSRAEGLAAVARDRPGALALFTAYLDNLDAAHCNPVPGTAALMQRLAAGGHRLFALTNAQVASIEAVRRAIPEMTMFEDVLISAEEGLLKPDPQIYRRLLARNGLSAEQALFIDDSARNVEGAMAAGLDAVRFTDAGGLEQDLAARGLL